MWRISAGADTKERRPRRGWLTEVTNNTGMYKDCP